MLVEPDEEEDEHYRDLLDVQIDQKVGAYDRKRGQIVESDPREVVLTKTGVVMLAPELEQPQRTYDAWSDEAWSDKEHPDEEEFDDGWDPRADEVPDNWDDF